MSYVNEILWVQLSFVQRLQNIFVISILKSCLCKTAKKIALRAFTKLSVWGLCIYYWLFSSRLSSAFDFFLAKRWRSAPNISMAVTMYIIFIDFEIAFLIVFSSCPIASPTTLVFAFDRGFWNCVLSQAPKRNKDTKTLSYASTPLGAKTVLGVCFKFA
jgi:hypothetical protein